MTDNYHECTMLYMKTNLKRTLTSLGTVALVSGSLLFGAGAAQAASCPAGQHWNNLGGGAGYCAPNASGGGTGGSGTSSGGGGNSAPVQGPAAPVYTPPKAPVYAPAPVYTPPKVVAPPAYTPPRVVAPPAYTPPRVVAPPAYTPPKSTGGYVAPSTTGGYTSPPSGGNAVSNSPTSAPASRGTYVDARSGAAVAQNDNGEWVNQETGVAADPAIAEEAAAAKVAAEEAGKAEAAAFEAAAKAKTVEAVTSAAGDAVTREILNSAIQKALNSQK